MLQSRHSTISSPARAATTIASPDSEEREKGRPFFALAGCRVVVRAAPRGLDVDGAEEIVGVPAPMDLEDGEIVPLAFTIGMVVAFTLAEAGTGNLATEPVWVGMPVALVAVLTVLAVVACFGVEELDGKNGLGASAARTLADWLSPSATRDALSAIMLRIVVDLRCRLIPTMLITHLDRLGQQVGERLERRAQYISRRELGVYRANALRLR